MSSHPGTTMNDAVEMALWLKKWGYLPEQVQDFYPTPGTVSTVMYYTGINPLNDKKVYVTTDYREKQLQRALLQYSKPENANLVREALKIAGREDLIGTSPECLVRPAFRQGENTRYIPKSKGKEPSRRGTATSPKAGKSTTIDRVFGKDAERIRREAAKMVSSGRKNVRKAGTTKPNKGGKR